MKNGLIIWDHQEIPEQEIKRRIETMQKRMDEGNIDALILFGDVNEAGALNYFSNFAPYYFSAALILTCVGEGIMTTAMAQRSKSWIQSNSLIQDIRFQRDYGKGCLEVLKGIELKYNKVGIVEFDLFPYTAFLNMKKEFPDVAFIDASGIVNEMRSQRSPVEISLIRHAGQIACGSLESLVRNWEFKKECELSGEIERQARYRRCEDIFVHIASHKNGLRWLHLPTEEELEQEVMLEMMVQYKNYWAVMGRTVLPKHARPSLVDLKIQAESIYSKGLKSLKSGIGILDIFGEIRNDVDESIKIISSISFGLYVESMQRIWINDNLSTSDKNVVLQENMEVIFQLGLLDKGSLNKFLIQDTFLIGKNEAQNLTETKYAMTY
jgi:Xaa-Pro aminopeptidase